MKTSDKRQPNFFLQPRYYRLKVFGEIETNWNDYFMNLHISTENGITTIEGMVSDQSELHGVLSRVRNLNLPILSIESAEESSSKKTKIHNEDQN